MECLLLLRIVYELKRLMVCRLPKGKVTHPLG